MPPKLPQTLKYFFLTVRFHPNDIPLFNSALLEYIIPFVEETDQYYWCVENDNTKSQHFHTVIGGTWRDAGALQQKLRGIFNKIFKNVKCETSFDRQFKTKSVNLSHQLDGFNNKQNVNTLGYIQKEKSQNPRKSTNFPDDTLEKSLSIFLNSLSIKQDLSRHSFTILNLTNKNILTEMLDFIISSELKLENLSWHDLENLAIDFGYSFVQISQNNKEQVEKELRRRINPENSGYEYNTLQKLNDNLKVFCEQILYNQPRDIFALVDDLIEQFQLRKQFKDKDWFPITDYFNR